MPCSWNFAQTIRDERSTKVAKRMVVRWHLIFYSEVKFASVCICMGPIHLYGKNVDNLKWLFLWSLWASVAQISCRASLGQENERLLKWAWSIDQNGCHAHIWEKPLKSSPEPNKPRTPIFAQIMGDRRSTKIAKMMVLCWRLTFLWQGQICIPVHLYGPYTYLYWKYWDDLRISGS